MAALNVLIVVESMFGNTRQVADAIASELALREGSGAASVTVSTVDDADPGAAAAADLLIVGGPTHAFSASRPSSRASVATKWPDIKVPERGIREFVESLAPGRGKPAASFDTRVDKSQLLTGSAARALQRKLHRQGYRIAATYGSFRVSGTEGPLVDGELERARNWARNVLASPQDRAGSDA